MGFHMKSVSLGKVLIFVSDVLAEASHPGGFGLGGGTSICSLQGRLQSSWVGWAGPPFPDPVRRPTPQSLGVVGAQSILVIIN